MGRGANAEAVMALVTRLVVGGVFVYAGATKALDPAAFAAAIAAYRLLPYPAVAALALYLPWLEMACGLGLFWPRLRLGASSMLFALCAVFTIAIASAWIRDLDISCGCFGAGATGAAALRHSLLRSITLAFLSAGLLWQEQATPAGEDRRTSPPPSGGLS